MTTCSRTFFIDAGHRLTGHKNRCKNLHGHRFGITVTCEAKLNGEGMVMDFGDLKDKIGEWLNDYVDHSCIVWEKDRELIKALSKITAQKTYMMPVTPTAENMAHHFWQVFTTLLQNKVSVVEVEVRETPNCVAVFSLRK